jgi:small subunit ribosomal protein S1
MITSTHSLESLASFLQQAFRRYAHEEDKLQPECSLSVESAQDNGPYEDFQPRSPYLSSPEMDAAWDRITAIYGEGRVVSAIVTGWNRGGLLVRWDELQGFVPASQLKDIPIFENDDSRDEQLARWVGEELSLKVIELDRNRNRLVFSERATIWGPKDGDRILSEITPGQIRQGYVSNICDFGAFVDLGGIDGLIHVSELSWGRVSHPRELLEIGQAVSVYVISLDQANRRVALSLKRLRPDPWTIVDTRYHVGQVLSATITNVVDFGAFARIEDGLEGLVHVSELADTAVTHPSEVVQPGLQVQVTILRIDSGNHRLGLSIRKAAEQPPVSRPAHAPQGAEWGAESQPGC